ncbi:MAG: DnaB-like helicase C-terminal domain-containing protein [Candidatus Phosphoribacter baldrii]
MSQRADRMDQRASGVVSLADLLMSADARLRGGDRIGASIWPTGFDPLDGHLGGGLRGGELTLIGGPQGLGKTTMALQMVRNAVAAGRSAIVFSYEHEARTLMERLIALEASTVAGRGAATIRQIRDAFEDRAAGPGRLTDRLAHLPGAVDAITAQQSYAACLHLHESSGSTTDLKATREMVAQLKEAGEEPLVLVDYLQKVPVPGNAHVEEERVTEVVEGLKDLALAADLPVVAIVAAEKSALVSGHRMRLHDLRGSSALAYEADVALILNGKYDVVARHHLMYDVSNAERFKQWVVVSVEKNRGGLADISMEFEKRFQEGRFEPKGRMVQEQLIEERVFVE